MEINEEVRIMIKDVLKTKTLLKKKSFFFAVLLSVVCLLLSCNTKKENYLPRDNDASLASIRFSEGLKVEEKFDRNVLDYNLKVKSQKGEDSQSQFAGFFVICIPDHPQSKSKISIDAKITVKELNNVEIPFQKDLPLPFVPLRVKLKTSDLLPNLPNIPPVSNPTGSSIGAEMKASSPNLLCNTLAPVPMGDVAGNVGTGNGENTGNPSGDSSTLPQLPPNTEIPPELKPDPNNPNVPKLPLDPNNPNLPKLPFDPNDPKAPKLPIDPNNPDIPPDLGIDPKDFDKLVEALKKLPDLSKLPEFLAIELSKFDIKIVVTSPQNTEKVYTVHGKVEDEKIEKANKG